MRPQIMEITHFPFMNIHYTNIILSLFYQQRQQKVLWLLTPLQFALVHGQAVVTIHL